jgi:hypothetical protein
MMKGDYDDQIEDGEVSGRTKKALEKGRRKLRQRVIERGIVQFRADAQFMERLLDTAELRKVPPGVLCREWVWERLQLGAPAKPQPYFSPSEQGHSEVREDAPYTAPVSADNSHQISSKDVDILLDEMKALHQHFARLESRLRQLRKAQN